MSVPGRNDSGLGLKVLELIDAGRNGFGPIKAGLETGPVTGAKIDLGDSPFDELQNLVTTGIVGGQMARHIKGDPEVVIDAFGQGVVPQKRDRHAQLPAVFYCARLDQEVEFLTRNALAAKKHFAMVAIATLLDPAIDAYQALGIVLAAFAQNLPALFVGSFAGAEGNHGIERGKDALA
eukprot:jgi/Tetstr1/453029/TSEL_040065.t1